MKKGPNNPPPPPNKSRGTKRLRTRSESHWGVVELTQAVWLQSVCTWTLWYTASSSTDRLCCQKSFKGFTCIISFKFNRNVVKHGVPGLSYINTLVNCLCPSELSLVASATQLGAKWDICRMSSFWPSVIRTFSWTCMLGSFSQNIYSIFGCLSTKNYLWALLTKWGHLDLEQNIFD